MMTKRILTLIITLIIILPLTACFGGVTEEMQQPETSVYDDTEEYEHIFLGITGGSYENYIEVTPITGTSGELEHKIIKVNRILPNGDMVKWLPVNSRVCVKYNGDISSGETPSINATVSIVPSTFPICFKEEVFNIGLIKEYFNFEKDAHLNALNADKVPENGKEKLPVYVVNSVKDFQTYFFGNIKISTWDGDGPIPVESVYEYLGDYDKEFFKNKSLILVFIEWHTGSADFEISDIIKSDNAIDISVKNLYSGMTCDLGEWIFIVEVDKDYLDGITEYNASINSPY